jgi:hypothetical protein
MKTYAETGEVWSITDRTVRPYTATFTQPRWRHAVASFYENVWARATWPLYSRLEGPLWKRHDAKCLSLCAVFVDGDGNEVDGCSYVPLTNRQDLRAYDLAHAKRVELERTLGEAKPMDWSMYNRPLP